MNTDVLIVGGGPAGLATALALRQRGASVVVADSRQPPIDKACGEGLMPDSLSDLARLGIHLGEDEGAAFQGIRFVSYCDQSRREPEACEVATARFPSRLNGAQRGIGLRRQSLHSRMVESAIEAGVVCRWNCPVQLKQGTTIIAEIMVSNEAVRYGTLIGADGQASQVRRWAGLEDGSVISRRFGFRRHYAVRPWSQYVEVHWSKSGQAYVTPTGHHEVCVAAVARDPHCRLDALLEEMPTLRRKLGIVPSSPDAERGCLTTTRRLARISRGRIALAGDASGTADAITGEGLGMAFRQGILLADCIAANDLARYDKEHPRILRLPQTMARVMLMMDRSPAIRARAIHMLASQPALFDRMLEVHLGSESMLRFIAAKGMEVAWRMAVVQRRAHSTAHPA